MRETPPNAPACRRILSTTSSGLPISSAPFPASLCVETRTRHRRPPALLPDIRHCLGVSRKEGVSRLLRGVCDLPEHVDANGELLRGVPVLRPGLAMEIDQGPESPGFTADNGHH